MKTISISLTLLALASCSGVRTRGDNFTAHGDSLNLLGFQIPGDDYEAALKRVPEGAQIHTVSSAPSDWDSVLGVINRIIGIGYTEISGKK